MNDNDELEFDFGVADFEMPAVQQNSKPATKANNKYLVAAQGPEDANSSNGMVFTRGTFAAETPSEYTFGNKGSSSIERVSISEQNRIRLREDYDPDQENDSKKYTSFKGKNKASFKKKKKKDKGAQGGGKGAKLTAQQRMLLERDDLGEAAEWRGKTLNVNYKGSDDEDEFDFDGGGGGGGGDNENKAKKEDDFEFDAILQNKEVPKKSAKKETNKSAGQAGGRNLDNRFDKYKNPNFGKDVKKKRFRSGGAGFFANNLASKAKEIESKKKETGASGSGAGNRVPSAGRIKGISDHKFESVKEQSEFSMATNLTLKPSSKEKDSNAPTSKKSKKSTKSKKKQRMSRKFDKEEEDEWNLVTKKNKHELQNLQSNSSRGGGGGASLVGGLGGSQKKMTFSQAHQYFTGQDLTSEKSRIVTEISSVGLMDRILGCFKSKLEIKHVGERDLIFCIGKVSYDDNNPTHYSILSAIFHFFKPTQACPGVGEHWKTIGFQSDLPSRDIRGSGMLGPLQILFLSERHKEWLLMMYQHSRKNEYSFPLVVYFFGFSLLTLKIFRLPSVWGYLNKQTSVFQHFNEMFIAASLTFYSKYKKGGYSYRSYGQLKSEVESKVMASPLKCLRIYKEHRNNSFEETLEALSTF